MPAQTAPVPTELHEAVQESARNPGFWLRGLLPKVLVQSGAMADFVVRQNFPESFAGALAGLADLPAGVSDRLTARLPACLLA